MSSFKEEVNILLDLRSRESFQYGFTKEWPVHASKWIAFEEIAALQPEKPKASFFPGPEDGCRNCRWEAAEIARAALAVKP